MSQTVEGFNGARIQEDRKFNCQADLKFSADRRSIHFGPRWRRGRASVVMPV